MEEGQLWRQYIIGGIVNIAVAAAGYSMGWSSPVNIILVNEELSPLPEPLTTDQLAWIGSLLAIGAIGGPFIGGLASSTIGRKWGLLSSSIPFLVGWILVVVATDVGFIYAGRVLWGVGMGMVFSISPVYCTEIATVEARGALGSLLQTYITFGTLAVYIVGPFASYNAIAYVGIGFVAVFAMTFFFMPESPTYYVVKNDRESAAACLAKIRGKTVDNVQKELDIIQDDVDASKDKTGRITDIFRGKNFKAFYIACGLMFFQQFAGISAVLFYLTEIFEAADTDIEPAYASIIVGAVQFLASISTQFVVNRLGRKTLMMVSSSGSAVALGLLGLYFLLDDLDSADSINFLPLLSLVLYMVMFCWGLGALPWTMMGELLPIEIKSVAAPIVTAFYWALSFLITRYFSAVGDAAGMYVVFWIFSASCIGCFFFSLLVLPETKNKSYHDIQQMLEGSIYNAIVLKENTAPEKL
ncbi:hypothetical protein ABMA27_009604 [Loxostege sticticalis]|uniref:Major facilitator superfamily (MFS) profile domain-containing protein n=1 Tax=Loxostege sticticalis TaxID=481309 RepID=A0ABR3H8H5_LOXSC